MLSHILFGLLHGVLTVVENTGRQNGIGMGQNIPNPANGVTTIPYDLQEAANLTFSMGSVLGNLLELDGFQHDNAEQVRAEALADPAGIAARLDNHGASLPAQVAPPAAGLERVADVPIYAVDPLVRRAESLQRTADARAPLASLPSALWAGLGLRPGDAVRIVQGGHTLVIAAVEDPSLAPRAVRVPAGHRDTAALGPMFGAVTVTRA